MQYQNTIEFARLLDEQDPLKLFRSKFYLPQHEGNDAVYLCGNSLGLQPVAAKSYLAKQLTNWQKLGVEGWFEGSNPWLKYHDQLTPMLSALVGANKNEVTVMNSLTVNLHLLMVSFYKPGDKKYKILVEGRAFPSDQYALECQVKYHGFDPKNAIIEIVPRKGEDILRTEDIVDAIRNNADELALVLFGGINYYTGQFFDMEAITKAAHNVGVTVGFDLAHVVGNVPVKLHNWGVDFACWCSYKYLNSGPGGISGIFIHEKHFNHNHKRFAGWWGHRKSKQFLMAPEFDAEPGADGWQVSTPPIMLMALHKASLDIFTEAGGLEAIRAKSELLTGYLEFIINEINHRSKKEIFKIITPGEPERRGSQLSIICTGNAREIFKYLTKNGIIGDWREPNVIRLSPVPLYNSFTDVFKAGKVLEGAVKDI